jgi:hypothetical protein
MRSGGPSASILIGLLAMAPAGCSVYELQYVYEPAPFEAAAAGDEPVRALVSVIGVRRADRASGLPPSVEVRLRIENDSQATVSLDPAGLELVSADLQSFPEPIVRPPGGLEIPPGESRVIATYFPFPLGRRTSDLDLDGLNVRFRLRIAGRETTTSAGFARHPWAYYDRYPRRIGVGYMRWDY